MTHHWVSDPIGFIVPLTEKSKIQVGHRQGAHFVIDTVTIVKTNPTAELPKSFYVTRYLPDFVRGDSEQVPIRLLEVPVSKGEFAPTHKVEWHFKYYETIDLGFGQVEPPPRNDGFELHLSGNFINSREKVRVEEY